MVCPWAFPQMWQCDRMYSGRGNKQDDAAMLAEPETQRKRYSCPSVVRNDLFHPIKCLAEFEGLRTYIAAFEFLKSSMF